MTEPTRDALTDDWDRYYGIRDFVHGGFDGLIRQRCENGGMTLAYLTPDGWVEENALIFDLHDSDTRPISEDEARLVAAVRFERLI
jgi:hypothetical protein